MSTENFFIDTHFYAVKCSLPYSNQFIESPPTLRDYIPFERLSVKEVGFGNPELLAEAEQIVTYGGFVDSTHEPAIAGVKFLSLKLESGDAIISPDGAIFILIPVQDYEREMKWREVISSIEGYSNVRHPMITIPESDFAALRISGNDHELIDWVKKHYKS